LEEKIREKIVWPSNINFRRYATGDVIGTTPLDPVMSEKYGYP
jgi:salicylate hydroxylase